jgi:hypothetical protein
MRGILPRFISRVGWMAMALIAMAIPALSQTILPPIAEYRVKGGGMVELRNDGDVPLAVIVEVKGFTVDEDGRMAYVELDPAVRVALGASSFVIPPRQSHMVFYKVQGPTPPYWFAILATFTKAVPLKNEMRVNIILPHIVYVYQKQALKKQDVQLALAAGAQAGQYRLEVRNLSPKASRVETIECKGFEKPVELGGMPLFPAKPRFLDLDTGATARDPRCKVSFEEGFSMEVAPARN